MKNNVFYSKKINLGKVDLDGTGKADYSASIELNLADEAVPKLSICGEIRKIGNRDFDCIGQCYEELQKAFPNSEKVARIVEIWKEYHLNDMSPECEHQRAEGWRELASESVEIITYRLKSEFCSLQRKIERESLEILQKEGTVTISEEDKKILSLPYSTKVPEVLGSEYYELDKKEYKTRGWIRYDEDSRGLLCKPCPVCGYKYGTAWKTRPIPAEIIAEIKTW